MLKRSITLLQLNHWLFFWVDNLKISLEGATKVVLRHRMNALRNAVNPVAKFGYRVEDRLKRAIVIEMLELSLHLGLQTTNEFAAIARVSVQAAFLAHKFTFAVRLRSTLWRHFLAIAAWCFFTNRCLRG